MRLPDQWLALLEAGAVRAQPAGDVTLQPDVLLSLVRELRERRAGDRLPVDNELDAAAYDRAHDEVNDNV